MDIKLSEEQLMLQATVRDFAKREIEPRSAEMEQARKIPDDLLRRLSEISLLGMTVPKEYDGGKTGGFAHILSIEQLAYTSTPIWWPVAFNNSLPETICHFGTSEQKERFVKGMFDGTKLFSVQFTEPETGSDPNVLITRSRPDGNYHIINGQKRFSTFGARDGTVIVWTRDETGGCTAFLIEKNMPGYSATKIWELMGTGGIEAADVCYTDLRVSKDCILHEQGKGMEVLQYWIAIEKLEGCMVAVALAQAALDESIKYTKSRMVRGRPMSDMQGIRWELADMYSKIMGCRWYTYRTAMLYEQNDDHFSIEASACKIFVQPLMSDVIATALRLHGGYGYTKEFKVERLYRAQPANTVISVSLEINKSIVGSILVH